LITQPAERVSHTPAVKMMSVPSGGTPSAASHSAHQVGQSNSRMPIGRSPRINFQ
jgi:hypothetical protein